MFNAEYHEIVILKTFNIITIGKSIFQNPQITSLKFTESYSLTVSYSFKIIYVFLLFCDGASFIHIHLP